MIYAIPITLQLLVFIVLVFLIGFLPIPFLGSLIFLFFCVLFLIPPPLAFFGAILVFVLNVISFILFTIR